MENRSKFYGLGRDGKLMTKQDLENPKWSRDTLKARYKHIKDALDAYKGGCLNKDDIKFVIKNAFVSKVYISVGAMMVLDNPERHGTLSGLYKKLLKERVLVLHDVRDGDNIPFQPYFDICKLAERYPGIIIEHVVPGDVFVNDVIKNIDLFDFEYFKEVFDSVSICLVTARENKILDGLKSNMPEDLTGNHIDYKTAPFARYDANLNGLCEGVEVYGWSFNNGKLK